MKKHNFDPVVIANDIRSIYNVGSFFRTCDAAGVSRIILTGKSAHPPHPRLEKTALGSTKSVNWEYHPDIETVLSTLSQEGFTLMGLETEPRATSIYDISYRSKTCFIFGNEVSGINPTTLNKLDVVSNIPMYGLKTSLNVAVSVGVVLYEWRRKYSQTTACGCKDDLLV